jgi:predicted RNase H-like nuclease (RuvC/YqgF family)
LYTTNRSLKARNAELERERDEARKALEALKKRFFFLKADFSRLSVKLAPEDIDRAFSKESFPHRLLSELAQEARDREALQAAFELIQEISGEASGQATKGGSA